MKKCKQGYYYCHTDKKCKRIPTGYRVGLGGYLRKETGEEQGENDNADNTNGNGNGNGNSNGGSNGGGVSEGTLHKWFKGSKSKDGKGGWVNVVTGGTCASDEPGEGTPKCVSSAKRASMSKSERLSAARRKKKADPGQQQKSGAAKPTYVSTDKKKMKGMKEEQGLDENRFASHGGRDTDAGSAYAKPSKGGNKKGVYTLKGKDGKPLFDKKEEVQVTEGKDKKGKGSGTKDACYHKVKSRYSVWPSAYASGALVKCRKVGAANWGNKSEEMDYTSFADRAKKTLEKNKKKALKGETKTTTTKEEWIVDNAAQYFFNEGINEEGLVIFIEELGVENFVEFVHDLAEDSELIEAYALTGKKKTPKRLPKGTQPAKTTKATIARGDRTIKAASPSGAFKKRPAAEKAVETAKKQQPKKRPVLDSIARQVLKGMDRHKKAMARAKQDIETTKKIASKIGKGAKEFGKGVKSGVETAGKVAKVAKKAVTASESVQYSDWRDDFKAMEYEFIDLIKPEPLVSDNVSEGNSFEIKKEVPEVPTQGPEVPRKMTFKTSELTKRIGRNIEKIKNDPNHPVNRVREEVETIDEAGKKCWKGYKKAGTQKLFGKTYNRCVKANEEFVDEAKDETEIGITGLPIPKKKRSPKKQYEFEKARRRNLGTNVGGKTYKKDVTPYYNPRVKEEVESDWRSEIEEGAAWTKKSGKNPSGGLNEKGRKSYERENPGSDLKRPSKKKGNKRRASFCARMKGMKKKLTSSKTANDPDSRINKSLRAWNC